MLTHTITDFFCIHSKNGVIYIWKDELKKNQAKFKLSEGKETALLDEKIPQSH